MLVDHLADAVPEQHDELVERINLALQLDAVDEVNRNGDAFLSKRVQERILQRLATGHGKAPCFLCRLHCLVTSMHKATTFQMLAQRHLPIVNPMTTLQICSQTVHLRSPLPHPDAGNRTSGPHAAPATTSTAAWPAVALRQPPGP